MRKGKWKGIGMVGVDSGQLMIADPCYVLPDKRDKVKGKLVPASEAPEYLTSCCGDGQNYRQLKYKMGHIGLGVVFQSGYGDGVYPVEARENEEGRIVEVRIRMY